MFETHVNVYLIAIGLLAFLEFITYLYLRYYRRKAQSIGKIFYARVDDDGEIRQYLVRARNEAEVRRFFQETPEMRKVAIMEIDLYSPYQEIPANLKDS